MNDVYEPTVPQVDVDELKAALDHKDPCIILDVRTAEEVARGKIGGSVHLPIDRLHEEITSLIPEKSAKVYVYCLSGSRSVHAVATMMSLGYTNVFDVSHGLLAWRVKGYPVVC